MAGAWSLLLGVTLATACATPRENPFRQATGPVTISVVNRSRLAVEVTILAEDERHALGLFLGSERREVRIQWTGDGQIRARLRRPHDPEVATTFPRWVEPGDRFRLVVDQRLDEVQLVRY